MLLPCCSSSQYAMLLQYLAMLLPCSLPCFCNARPDSEREREGQGGREGGGGGRESDALAVLLFGSVCHALAIVMLFAMLFTML
jgi:hypothetical protein